MQAPPVRHPLFNFKWQSTHQNQLLPPDDMKTAPSEMTSITLPLWFVAWPFLLPFLFWLRTALHTRQRLRHGLCLHCGYDVRASSGHCPECGNVLVSTSPN
jgi:hypothetical protein